MGQNTRVMLVNEGTGEMIVLPRNPDSFLDEQTPDYATETLDGATYQALHFKNGGARDFSFRLVLLPEIDGGARVTGVMRFLFGLVEPMNYTDPDDGVTRFEPPDVSFIYGGMVRRGKVMKRPANYNYLDQWVGCRELTLELTIRKYSRKSAYLGQNGLGQQPEDYDTFREKSVSDFKATEADAVTLRGNSTGPIMTPE